MAESLNSIIAVRATHNDGTANDETYTLLRAATAIDFVVIATDANPGAVTLQNGALAISAALDPGTLGDTRVVRTDTGGVWDQANRELALGAVLTFNPGVDTGDWEAYAYLYPIPAVAE